ncbi:hypothetical protein HYV89_00940 [Candidatus Woesearchaeota archaeon]|nr:hypothetical protein [Candidatus Woesearchaeota archaeon]
MKSLKVKESELVGIILGDGHLSKHTYGIIVTGGKGDFDYITKYIPGLFEQLFSKKPSIRYIKGNLGGGIQSVFYSKKVFNYMIKTYGLKYGKKFDMQIPELFFRNKKLLKSCMRGLFDTDGGIYRHHKNSIQIVFYNSDYSLIKSVFDGLRLLGYNPKICYEKRGKYHVDLFTEDSRRFVEKIGFSSPKNKLKYGFWLKNGRVPKNSEITNAVAEN